MVRFNFTYDANVGLEQRVGFEMAAIIWASVLTDDVDVNLHIGATDSLDNGNAVGGAIPILQTQNYGIFQEYYQRDITSIDDSTASGSMQIGNTVDLAINGEVVDGNTDILLTSAQAKALGMHEATTLDNGTVWERGLVSADALDGYIVVNNSFDWSYDFTRSEEAHDGTLDFLSMALHEIGHNLGFVSGLDGAMDVLQLHSGETRIEDFTALDLFRHTVDTAKIENSDGSVSSVSLGENAYFSIDGGQTNLADFSTGKDDEVGGDGFQASHWKRLQNAMGIMDPTLAYKERLSLSTLDLQAMDVLGWDVDYQAIEVGLDFETILRQSELAVANDLGVDSSVFANSRTDSYLYSLSHDQLLDLVKEQMLSLGYSRLWQAFELGYSRLWQEQESSEKMLELGYSRLWQEIESQMLSLGYSRLWQEFQDEILKLGYSRLWQAFELSYSRVWQELDPHLDTVRDADKGEGNGSTVNYSASNRSVVVSGGDADDILAGSGFRDLVSGGGGDDLIDGKGGNDNLMGEAGNDILYGWNGDDKLYGGSGNDVVSGEDGDDRLYGEEGHDILSGGFGNDLMAGGKGKDQLRGDADNDVIYGGEGDDDANGGEGNDIVIGGTGSDIVIGGKGNDVLYGDDYAGSTEEVSVENIAAQAGMTANEEKSPIDFWVRLEVEDLKLENFSKQTGSAMSGGGFVSTGGEGTAQTTFSGPTGLYDIVVGYYDESDGAGRLAVEIGEGNQRQQFDWALDKQLGNAGVGPDNFTTYTIRGVEIEAGEGITLRGTSQGSEFMRVDYVDVVSTTEGTKFASAQFYNGSLYLHGQAGGEEEATGFGGELISATVGSAEAHWLDNTLGYSQNIIKIDVSDSQFNLVQDAATLNAKKTTRMEAEAFELAGGYAVEQRGDYSSGQAVIANHGYSGGRATSTFTGESGIYDIFVSHLETSGNATASISINGHELSQWQFDGANDMAGYKTVGSQIYLDEGASIEIEGWAHGDDKARIDYVEFVSSVIKTSDENTLDSEGVSVPVGEETLIEAESIWFDGTGSMNDSSVASGGRYATLNEASGTTLFEGETGYYDVVVSYYDNNDYRAQLSFDINEEQQDQWSANQTGTHAFVERRVASGVHLTSFSDYLKINGTTADTAKAYVDYVKLIRVADPVVAPVENSSDIVIEAESIRFSGSGAIKDSGSASEGQYAQMYEATGSKLFRGETGHYDIVVSYLDNNDSSAQLTLNLNGEVQDQWLPNQTGSNTFVERTVASNVLLTDANDYLQLVGRSNGGASSVDYIKLVRVDAPTEPGVVEVETSSNSDIIRGGQGNDTLYGGQGNDILYGEDEFDNGLSNPSDSQDVLFGEDGDDTLYGNSGDDWLYGDGGQTSTSAVMTAETLVFQQGVNGYAGTADTTIRQSYATTELGNYSVMSVDQRGGRYDEQGALQALLKFEDIFGSQGEQIASDSVINSAVIELQVYNSGSSLNVHEMLQSWNESSNWNSLNNGIQVNGVEAASTPVASTGFVNTGVLRIDVTESLRSWQTDPTKNQGWAFLSTGGNGVDFYASENSGSVPRLIVDVETPESPRDIGNDSLYGGKGNDRLEGNEGDDSLDGSDAIALGFLEIDTLLGGGGADLFVLGSGAQSYYIGGGNSDYALIGDFDSAVDVLQLSGGASDYQQQQQGGDLLLSQGQDLIAILKNTGNIDMNSSAVRFV